MDLQNIPDSQRNLFLQQEGFIESRGAAMMDLITLYKAPGLAGH